MWKIMPLNLGTLNVTLASQICRHGVVHDVGRVVKAPCIAFLLKETKTGELILVDAGPAQDTEWGRKWHNPIERSEEQQLVYQLDKHGVKPEDIKTVILTHLHWDHAYGVLLLPEATVYVQKVEMQYSVAPMRTDYKHYEINVKTQIPFFMNFFNRIELVNGDTQFRDGLEVITLPGHSPGSQGVVADTEKGKFIMAGDLINTVENWETRIPSGIYGNMQDSLDSLDKMEQYDAVVLPSHDFAAFDMV